MAFNTPVFVVFFVVVLMLYALMPKRYKWIWLLAASWFFYLYASAKFFIFVLLSGASAWAGTLYIQRLHDRARQLRACDRSGEELKHMRERLKRRQKRMLISVLVLNFGILAVLKYFGFFCENLNQLLESFSLEARIPGFHLILPLGISFYTFQTMSYVIDVYWKKTKAERNPFKVSLFVSFFPQIIEGPIGRWNDLSAQLTAGRLQCARRPQRTAADAVGIFQENGHRRPCCDRRRLRLFPLPGSIGLRHHRRRLPVCHARLCGLLRLHRYRQRLCKDDGHRYGGEFSAPLFLPDHPGILAALAHVAWRLDERLCLLSVFPGQRRAPHREGCAQTLRPPSGQHPADRAGQFARLLSGGPMAWGKLELYRLGSVLRHPHRDERLAQAIVRQAA